MPDHSSSDGHQGQCRRAVPVEVELHAAVALADMAGAGPANEQARPVQPVTAAPAPAAAPQATAEHEDEEMASTRLSLELGNVGIQSSPCSSGSSSGAWQPSQQAPQGTTAAAVSAAPGYGPRPRHMLTEAEKEAKRLRRVLANRESARQTILRRQAIRDELARKVADLSSQNENMKKEKDLVMEQYLSLKETNKQLKEQVAKTTKKKLSSTAPVPVPMDTAPPAHHAEPMQSAASPPPTPPQQGAFLYSAPPSAIPIPYVWGSWPPYEHHGNPAVTGPAPPLCLPPPCAWYYPVVPGGLPPSYVQPLQEHRAAAAMEPTACVGSGSPGGVTAEEDTDDDPCSLTLANDRDKKCTGGAAANIDQQSSSNNLRMVGLQIALSGREKAATAAEARKRRKELPKMKHMQAGSRMHGGEQC